MEKGMKGKGAHLIPTLTLLSPHAVFGMPCVHISIHLARHIQSRHHPSQPVVLQFSTTVQDVFDVGFVTRQHTSLALVAARAVYDEVIGEAGAGDARVHVGSALVLHDLAVEARDAEMWVVGDVEARGADEDVDFVAGLVARDDRGGCDTGDVVEDAGCVVLDQGFEVALSGRQATTSGTPFGDELFLQIFAVAQFPSHVVLKLQDKSLSSSHCSFDRQKVPCLSVCMPQRVYDALRLS